MRITKILEDFEMREIIWELYSFVVVLEGGKASFPFFIKKGDTHRKI